MSISVKSVYNTVLYAINKEQRGYVGPDEFNKFAGLAQTEIFEQYFSNLAHYAISPKGMVRDTGYSDLSKNLRMKIDLFADSGTLEYNEDTEQFDLPTNLYRLDTVVYKPNLTTFTVIPPMTKNESYRIQQSPLMKPSASFPKFERYGNSILVLPSSVTTNVEAQYIKMPATPSWEYNQAVSTATDGSLFFDAALSTDFELHESEEYRLVAKILTYAGLSTKEADVVQFASQADLQDMEIKRT